MSEDKKQGKASQDYITNQETMSQQQSRSYQWMLLERAHDPYSFVLVNTEYEKPEPMTLREEEIRDRLAEMVWEAAEQVLTPKQLQALNLLRSGLTQQEAGDRMGCNQSVVRYQIWGPSDHPSTTAGAINKLKQYLTESDEARGLLEELRELASD